MFSRLHVAVLVICLSLVTSTSLLLNADEPVSNNSPTAAQLYQQAIGAYTEGDLVQTRTLLRTVDPMELPTESRLRMYEILTELDVGSTDLDAPTAETTDTDLPQPSENATETTIEPATAPTPAELLVEADATVGPSPLQAKVLYAQLRDHPDADDTARATAKARLAQIQRRANAETTAARRLIDLAQAELAAGTLESAQTKLQSVRDSNVVLGWFDSQRLNKQLTEVQAALAAIATETLVADQENAEPTMAVADPAPEPEPVVKTTAADELAPDQQLAAADTSEPAPEPEPVVEIAAADEPAPDQQLAAADTSESAPEQPIAQGALPGQESDLMTQVRRAEAQKLAAEGQQAATAGQHALADKRYRQALNLDPENPDIEAAANLAQAQAAELQDPKGLLETTIGTNQLLVQKMYAEYLKYMNEARSQKGNRQYATARDAVSNAKTALDRDQLLISTARYHELRSAATQLASEIDTEARLWDAAEHARTEHRREIESRIAREEAEAAKGQEIEDLLRRASELQHEQKYDKALKLIEQALFLDPTNPGAQGMRDIIQDVRLLVQQKELWRLQDLMTAEQAVLNAEATVMYDDLITYPKDWPQLTFRRLSDPEDSGGDSEANRRVSLKLRDPVPISFEVNKLVNVIDYIRNTTGVNVFVNWAALEAAGVEPDAPITLQLSNVPAEQALRLVLAQVGSEFDPVTFSIIDGIVTVSTERDLQKTTDRRTYDIRDLLVQVPNFTDAPQFDLNEALSNTSSGGSGGGGGGGGGGDIFGDDGGEGNEDQPSRGELIEQIVNLIQDSIGRQEQWAAYGGDVSSVSELNGQLIVKSTPENHRQINELLAQLRETRATQISVESRFLVVQESFMEEVGLDFDFQINEIGSNFGPISVAQDSYSVAQRPNTILTPSRLQLEGGGGTIPGPGAFLPVEGFLPRTDRSMNLGVAYIDDLEVNLLIQATQANQRSVILTAPRVTFFNGQRAYVLVTEQVSFISDLEPVPDAAGFDVTVSVVNAGVVLDVEGTVSADRRYVTLTMRPSLADFRQFPFRSETILGTDDDQGGGSDDADDQDDRVIFEGKVELPEIRLTSVRSTVSIPDRGTLLIGGQRLVGENEIEVGVPVLSKLPILKRLFTNTSMNKDERTLLILVKPTIIIQSEEEENLFPGLQQNPGAYNIGQSF